MSNNKCKVVEAGEMTFVQAKVPPMDDGDYLISLTQSIVKPTVTEKTFNASLTVSVKGPRFALNPADIHSVFPPSKHQGTFGSALANIVLTRTTLPWERMLSPSDKGKPPPPWVALLVFDKSDFPNPPISNPTTSNNVVGKINGGSVADFFSTNGLPAHKGDGKLPTGTLGPTIVANGTPKRILDLWESPTDSCNFIDLPAKLFTDIVPYYDKNANCDELSLLAHVRNINTENKVIDGLTGDGCYSVVVANRFPKNPIAGTSGLQSTACLVSLEGFQSHLNATPNFPAGTNYVRLAVLANWSFVNTGPDDIGDLMSELDTGMLSSSGIAPSINTPPKNPTPQEYVSFAMDAGFAALNHQTRVGEQTVSWYRSPLSPFSTPLEGIIQNNYAAYSSSDQALRYDPGTGMFDISYAAAWQLGRLLALQNRYFATAVYNYKSAATQTASRLMSQVNLQNRYQSFLKFPDKKTDLLNQNLITELALDWLNAEILPKIAAKNNWDVVPEVVIEGAESKEKKLSKKKLDKK